MQFLVWRTSLTTLAEEGCGPVSQQPTTIIYNGDRSGERADQGSNRIPCVSRNVNGVKHVNSYYQVGRWLLSGL